MGRLYPGNTLFYNDNELTGITGLVIESIGVSDPPKRSVESYRRARAEGRAVVSGYHDERPIIVKGKFVANTQADFERARDTLLAMIYTLQGVLKTDVAGAPRLFNCTLDQARIPEHFGGLADVELDFNAYDIFGYDASYTTPASVNTTTSIKDFAVTIGGSAPTQLPIFILTVASVTGSSSSSILKLTNLTTGQITTITGTVTAGDVFTIDPEVGKVYKNGIQVDFGGPLPTAGPSLVYFRYSDSGITTRNVTIQPKYRKRYS